MINGGREMLEKDISIVVFPQSTRSLEFDIRHFNTIGSNWPQRAGVPSRSTGPSRQMPGARAK